MVVGNCLTWMGNTAFRLEGLELESLVDIIKSDTAVLT